MKRITAALFISATLVLGAAACGDDEETTTGAGSDSGTTTATEDATEVTVTTSDTADGYTWEVTPTPTAETESVTLVNESKEGHALIFARLGEGFTLDEAYELEGRKDSATFVAPDDEGFARPGKSVTVEVTESPLEPGDYALICPISGKDGPHYKLGQAFEFTL